jgi:hypothetical protein
MRGGVDTHPRIKLPPGAVRRPCAVRSGERSNRVWYKPFLSVRRCDAVGGRAFLGPPQQLFEAVDLWPKVGTLHPKLAACHKQSRTLRLSSPSRLGTEKTKNASRVPGSAIIAQCAALRKRVVLSASDELRLLFVGDICDAAAPRLAADAHRRLAAARPWTTDCERGTDFATSSVQPLVARLGLYFDEVFFFSESRFISLSW